VSYELVETSLTTFIDACNGEPIPTDPVACKAYCNTSNSDVFDGRESFPSGHTVVSFVFCGYMTLYALGKIHPRRNQMIW
jgi:membrane-associated phospholipid phosphatase